MHNLRRNRQENLAKIEIRTLAQLLEKGTLQTTSTGQQPVDTHTELQDNTLQPESPEMKDTGIKWVDPINVQIQDIQENAKLAEVDTSNSRHKLLIQILRLMKNNKSQRYLKIRHHEHHKMIIIELP